MCGWDFEIFDMKNRSVKLVDVEIGYWESDRFDLVMGIFKSG